LNAVYYKTALKSAQKSAIANVVMTEKTTFYCTTPLVVPQTGHMLPQIPPRQNVDFLNCCEQYLQLLYVPSSTP
jgi:hypothetical protein